jgi:hypothetical protein
VEVEFKLAMEVTAEEGNYGREIGFGEYSTTIWHIHLCVPKNTEGICAPLELTAVAIPPLLFTFVLLLTSPAGPGAPIESF